MLNCWCTKSCRSGIEYSEITIWPLRKSAWAAQKITACVRKHGIHGYTHREALVCHVVLYNCCLAETVKMPLCPFSCLLIFRRMQAWAETVNPQAAEPSRCKHRASALCLYCICIRCHRTKTNQALPSLLSWDSAGWGSSLGGRIARRHADWWPDSAHLMICYAQFQFQRMSDYQAMG
jgi:hypothetical protein